MSRAIVLGGGGVTGIAWEIGVLQGLRTAGVSLDADSIIGTSAGSFVGTALASGADWDTYFAQQHVSADEEVTTQTPPDLYQEWASAYQKGAGNPLTVGKALGQIALSRVPQTNTATRRRAVEYRLATRDFPANLRVTVQDALTGEIKALGPDSGFDIVDVVSASGAVPGVSPAVGLGGRTYIDGGMVSSTNIRFAEGFDEVLVIAPLPFSYGGLPDAAEELASLTNASKKLLITPDEASQAAIGSNIYDASRRAVCADAGYAQGLKAAVSW